MKVFVTGASGFIGAAVVRELLANSHQVVGLVRSDPAAQALQALGAQVQRGDLEDLPSLAKGAALADGVIHTAFIHDFSQYVRNCEIDRQAILAMGEALKGSQRPLVVTSGTALLSGHPLALEDHLAQHSTVPRVASEQAAAHVREAGVNASVVRLPPSVHGEGDHGFVPMLIGLARERGVAGYLGDGENRWPAVHRLDAARLFRLVLERSQAANYHAVAEQGIAFKAIAQAIGDGLKVPTRSVPDQQAEAHFAWMKHFAEMDNPASSAWTRQVLGWQPNAPGLLEDIAQAGYFA